MMIDVLIVIKRFLYVVVASLIIVGYVEGKFKVVQKNYMFGELVMKV